MDIPAKFKINVTTSWYMACPMIIFHIVKVIKGADLGSGLRFSILGLGPSVASAKAAKVSMIKFTQRSCTAVSTDVSLLLATAEMKVNTTAVTLTVIWNWLLVRDLELGHI